MTPDRGATARTMLAGRDRPLAHRGGGVVRAAVLRHGRRIAHCVNRLDNEARLARLAESQELARAVAHVRSSVLLSC